MLVCLKTTKEKVLPLNLVLQRNLKDSGSILQFLDPRHLALHSKKHHRLVEVVNFTGLLQLVNKFQVNKFQQTCPFHQVATCHFQTCCNLLKQLIFFFITSLSLPKLSLTRLYSSSLKDARTSEHLHDYPPIGTTNIDHFRSGKSRVTSFQKDLMGCR